MQQHPAGHTVLAGAGNAREGIGTQNRGLGPDQYRGRGRETEIITEGIQGHGRDRDLQSGGALALTLGRGPVLVLAQGPARDLARCRGRGQGRAIGEAVGESTHAGLALEARRRVAVAAVVESASDEGREAARRMYVFGFISISRFRIQCALLEGEERKEEKWNGIGCCGRPVGKIWYHK